MANWKNDEIRMAKFEGRTQGNEDEDEHEQRRRQNLLEIGLKVALFLTVHRIR